MVGEIELLSCDRCINNIILVTTLDAREATSVSKN